MQKYDFIEFSFWKIYFLNEKLPSNVVFLVIPCIVRNNLLDCWYFSVKSQFGAKITDVKKKKKLWEFKNSEFLLLWICGPPKFFDCLGWLVLHDFSNKTEKRLNWVGWRDVWEFVAVNCSWRKALLEGGMGAVERQVCIETSVIWLPVPDIWIWEKCTI